MQQHHNMKADLQVIGFAQTSKRPIAASGTKFYSGEPLHSTATSSSGAATANAYVVAAADTPVIGTHRFGGIAIKNSLNNSAAATIAQYTIASCPVGPMGRIRGKAETFTSVDTAAEILGLIGDYTLIDYAATGGIGSTPLYTIKEVASADTSGLEIMEGNPATGTLDVSVNANAYRSDIS